MVEGTLTQPNYVGRLSQALADALPGADVGHEQVRRDRYRFVVVSGRFEDIGHPERQRMVWDVAEQSLDPADLVKVAMIITMAPSEVGSAQAS